MALVYQISGSVPPNVSTAPFTLDPGQYYVTENAPGASCDWFLRDAGNQEIAGGTEGDTSPHFAVSVQGDYHFDVEEYNGGGPFNLEVHSVDVPSGTWVNVFDLAQWQVYLRYVGQTTNPSPDSWDFLVPIEELDPAIGAVSVINGEIICDMEPNDSGGLSFEVLLMPVGAPPSTSFARVSAYEQGEGLIPLEVPEGRVGNFGSVLQVIEENPNEYSWDNGTVSDDIASGQTIQNIVTTSEVPSGEGLTVGVFGGA